jgi:hypothetical protein
MADQKKKTPKARLVNAKEFAKLTGINLGAIQEELDDLAKKAREKAADEEE